MRPIAKVFQTTAMVAFLSMFALPILQAFARDCRFLDSPSKKHLEDRELYFHISGNPDWLNMKGPRPDLSRQRVDFAYVVLETFDESRSGVLVIKSGRQRPSQGEQASRAAHRVQLMRARQDFNNGTCGVVPPFSETSVSTKSYDDYHDRGLKVADTRTLDAFHFRYAGRRGCRRTNDDAVDSISPWDPRSNLSQFSFDPDVVARGTYSQTLAWFKPTPAYASSDNLSDQRVEMKQYHAARGQPMCVRFTLSFGGPGSFLRLNDLEGLNQSGLRFVRSDEQGWSLSQ